MDSSGIQWTAAGENSFTAIKEAIDNCPKLWFRDDSLPVYLQTDASDYARCWRVYVSDIARRHAFADRIHQQITFGGTAPVECG